MSGGLREAFHERHQPVEAHALDLETRKRASAARILKHGWDKSIISGGEIARHSGVSLDHVRFDGTLT
jgi:hypothetical protein